MSNTQLDEICKQELTRDFFNQDAQFVAQHLLGKVLCHKVGQVWLRAMIIETEAYYIDDKASHASQGWTQKRHALFMPGGTIYMYYARGGDSLNMSCHGEGNAVLCKAGVPYPTTDESMVKIMQQLNPLPRGGSRRVEKLCSGQTLLCKALNLKVGEWDQQTLQDDKLTFCDIGYKPDKIIQTTRMGIPEGRDRHLPYRFVDYNYAKSATKNPLTGKQAEYINIIT